VPVVPPVEVLPPLVVVVDPAVVVPPFVPLLVEVAPPPHPQNPIKTALSNGPTFPKLPMGLLFLREPIRTARKK
jgi:hypothetical protein